MADYQMEKTLGKCFRSKSDQFIGTVKILGSPYTYKVIEGIPVEQAMLQVVDYADNYLLVVVDNSLYESDVNFIVNC